MKQKKKIGATLNNMCLLFWDSKDKYNFYKAFYLNQFVQIIQTNIYYIDTFRYWITTDSYPYINVWDIENDKLHMCLNEDKQI